MLSEPATGLPSPRPGAHVSIPSHLPSRSVPGELRQAGTAGASVAPCWRPVLTLQVPAFPWKGPQPICCRGSRPAERRPAVCLRTRPSLRSWCLPCVAGASALLHPQNARCPKQGKIWVIDVTLTWFLSGLGIAVCWRRPSNERLSPLQAVPPLAPCRRLLRLRRQRPGGAPRHRRQQCAFTAW